MASTELMVLMDLEGTHSLLPSVSLVDVHLRLGYEMRREMCGVENKLMDEKGKVERKKHGREYSI